MKKLRVRLADQEAELQISGASKQIDFALSGYCEANGHASIEEVQENVFSILINHKSYLIYVAPQSGSFLAQVGSNAITLDISDLRDRPAGTKKQAQAGVSELRALMPGKVVKLLVAAGERVEAGQSLLVIEAMKMQNELKAPKEGTVVQIHVSEGAAVGAGERLLVVE